MTYQKDYASLSFAKTLRAQIAFALVLGLSFTGMAVGQGKGKGGGKGGGGEPPAPVEYEVHLVAGGWARSMNESGTIVGCSNWPIEVPGSLNGVYATRYTLGSNGFIEDDLNSLGATWIDLDGGPADGWIAVSAHDINDFGYIVGIAERIDPGTGEFDTGVFLLDPNEPPQFRVMPGPGPGPVYQMSLHGPKLNNLGEIASHMRTGWGQTPADNLTVYTPNGGGYDAETIEIPADRVDINDAGWLVGTYWNISPSDDPTGFQVLPFNGSYNQGFGSDPLIPGSRLQAINNVPSPTICGTRDIGKRKSTGPMRLPAGGGSADVELVGEGNWAVDINDDGDVLSTLPGSLYYEDGSGTSYNVADLIAPDDQALWDGLSGSRIYRSLSNRDATTGFGAICVQISSADDLIVLLVPRVLE